MGAENGGGQRPAPEGRQIGTPPPWDIYDTFPYKFFSDDKEMYGSKENFLDSKANILEIEFLAARRALKF